MSQTLLSSLQYDQYKTPMENIGLQDSLLSRFDLLFIVLDQMDPEQDREISDHVLRMHRYRDPREQEGAGAVDFKAVVVVEKYDQCWITSVQCQKSLV